MFLINIYNSHYCFKNEHLQKNNQCKSVYQKYFLDRLNNNQPAYHESVYTENLSSEFLFYFLNVLQNNNIYNFFFLRFFFSFLITF